MPGGSPAFATASDIERLYEHLEILFEQLAQWCRGLTLEEFHAEFTAQATNAHLPVSTHFATPFVAEA